MINTRREWLHATVQLLGLGMHHSSFKMEVSAERTLPYAAMISQLDVALCMLRCADINWAVVHVWAIQRRSRKARSVPSDHSSTHSTTALTGKVLAMKAGS